MLYTREMIIRMLAEKSGFYQRNVRILLNEFDDLLEELYDSVDDDEEVLIQLLRGVKLGAKVVPERERVDPRTHQPIICSPTVKPFTKWSENFKEIIQNQYDAKHSDG